MTNNKYSDLKIAAFPEKLRSFREGRITAPLYVRVKPTNQCDDDCHFCTYAQSNRKKDSAAVPAGLDHVVSGMHTDMQLADALPFAKLCEVLDDFKAMGVKAVTFSGGGEPLLYKGIVEAMERALRFGIHLSIITNGRHLDGERAEVLGFAKWVRVSIDYVNAAQRAQFRRCSPQTFDRVMENLQTFARSKQPDCDLEVNYIVHRHNCEGLVYFAGQLKELGVENVRFSPMHQPNFLEYHEPIKDVVQRQLTDIQKTLVDARFSVNSTYNLSFSGHFPERRYSKCFFMQTVPVVAADQKVYACHNKAYDPTGVIGSIHDKRFRELWFSEEARQVFEGLNPQCVCQHQCANDGKNLNINRLIETHVDNFV